MPTHPHRVFVYGTLLRGESNSPLLGRSEPCGPAHTAPDFTLVSCGGFPALIVDGATAVRGELYDVDDATLVALDRLEGIPTHYQRVKIALANGEKVWAYVQREAHGRPIIESGDWRAYRAANRVRHHHEEG